MLLHDFYFALQGLPFLIMGGLTLALQLFCLVHVVRRGKSYFWLWIVFGFPVLGSLAYIFLEVQPHLRLPSLAQLSWQMKGPAERVALLEGNLRESNTIRHRLALAAELSQQGKHVRECEVLAEGLRGVFQDDALLLLSYADAQLKAARPADAEATLARVKLAPNSHLRPKAALLTARVAMELNQTAKARQLFAELVPKYVGEEARFWYADLLARCGETESARLLYEQILDTYRRGTTLWRRSENLWYRAACERLSSMGRA